MKYYFTTLAINQPYLSNSINFYKQLHDRTEHAIFNITTTQRDVDAFIDIHGITLQDFLKNHPKIQITTIDQFNTIFPTPLEIENESYFAFNVNLKCLALKACVESSEEYDYVIYTDSDWNIYSGFEEVKILQAFEKIQSNEIDFVFERPAKIGLHKRNMDSCFFTEKIYSYNVLEHDLWDDADVVNEQFFIFKNNWKFPVFVMKWEQFLWYSIVNKIKNYAEGFEIGISALEATMNSNYYEIINVLKQCFCFYDRSGNLHIRF